MKKTIMVIALFSLIVILLSTFASASQGNLSLSDKEIIEKLMRLEEGQKSLSKRIDDVNESLNKRIDDLRSELKGEIQGLRSEMKGEIQGLRSELKGDIHGLRSELKGDIGQLGDRIDDLRNLMYVVLAGIIALIGFVIWDRRTALSPVISKTRELEERDNLTLRVLQEYARKEPRMAEVLKSLGML